MSNIVVGKLQTANRYVLDDFSSLSPLFTRGNTISVDFLPTPSGEELYKSSLDKLSSYLLIKDSFPSIEIEKQDAYFDLSGINWINRDEVIAGSFMSSAVRKTHMNDNEVKYEDIDIYFKCRDHAIEFCKVNNLYLGWIHDPHVMCVSIPTQTEKLNLIWGVEFDNINNLISRFDIRACAIAYDPNQQKLYTVNGANADIFNKDIVFNPVPRAVTIRRLVKYIEKGFRIDKWQRLFFAELLRSDIYSAHLEEITGY